MFATILATVLLATSLQLAAPSPSDALATVDHLGSARRAMMNGDFELARREYRAAADSSRSAGELPVEALRGLSEALYAQSYAIEAAWTMEDLSREASLRGDHETEALALADAIWLNFVGGDQRSANRLHTRLRALVTDTPLDAATLKVVKDRVYGLKVRAAHGDATRAPRPAQR